MTTTEVAFDENSSKETILAFIDVCEGKEEDDDSLSLPEQERLCRAILEELDAVLASSGTDLNTNDDSNNDDDDDDDFIRTSLYKKKNNKKKNNNKKNNNKKASVRSILGNLPSVTINQFATCLSDLMAHRVDPLLLLPATQDDAANAEVLLNTKRSITLTRHAFLAAQLYSSLLSMPGSFGAGLIDVGALANLSALVRRWCVESSSGTSTSSTSTSSSTSSSTTKGKRKTTSRTAGIKRSRNNNSKNNNNDDDDDDEQEYNDSFVVVDDDPDDDNDDNSGQIFNQTTLSRYGCQLARCMAQIPSQRDFLHWSDDALEVVLDAVVCAQMTTAALQAGNNNSNNGVVQELNRSLVTCTRHLAECSTALQEQQNDDDILSSSPSHATSNTASTITTTTTTSTAIKNRNTLVFLLRGIFSVLCMTMEVPQGQKGKEAAHAAAASTLEQMVAVLSNEYKHNHHSAIYNKQRTPRAKRIPLSGEASSPFSSFDSPTKATTKGVTGTATPRTGRKNRKKRVSFGTVAGGTTIDRITAPSRKDNTPSKRTPSKATSASINNNNKNTQSSLLLSTMVGMLQKILTRPDLDRSDKRQHAIRVLMSCLGQFNQTEEQGRLLRFCIPVCHSKVSVHRLAGVELVHNVLAASWLWTYHNTINPGNNDNDGFAAMSTSNTTPSAKSPMASLVDMPNLPSALLGCLVGRLSDKAPAVRARAAHGLVALLEAHQVSSKHEPLFRDALQPFLEKLQAQLGQRAVQDDRATVRKGAIVALSKLAVYTHVHATNDNDDDDTVNVDVIRLHVDVDDDDQHGNRAFQLRTTEILQQRCGSDPSVAARKAAADGLTQQLLLCDSRNAASLTATPLEHAWTLSVLPLVLDAEPTCVNLAVELFVNVVVTPLIEINNDGGDDSDRAWRILACVSDCTELQGATKGEYEALRTAVRKLSERDDCDRICIPLFQRIRNEAMLNDDEHRSAVWCLLQALTDQPKDLPVFVRWIKKKSVGHGFLTEPLTRMLELCKTTDNDSVRASLRCCLRVVGKLAAHLPANEAEVTVANLKEMLGQLCLGPEVISAAVTVLVECLRRSIPLDELRTACASMVDDLYAKCEEALSHVLEALGKGAHYVDDVDGASLPRAVFLCGELTMIGFRSDEDGSKTKNTDTCDPIIGLTPKPSNHLLNMIQALLPKTLPGDSVATPEPARAHAFVTLGKLCLRDEQFAKECLNMFARELHQNLAEPCIAVQSNALLVLGDLCIKYTNLVDRHLPVMAACLQAGATAVHERHFLVGANKSSATALVRKHAILMLSGLLLQDYIKWRGLLFHRFLVASSDTDEGVASLAEMTLCGPLLSKNSKLFFNNFVESLFILNKCTAHPIYMAAATAGGAGIAVGFEGIDLSGETGRVRRYQMYRMMLSKMSDEEKIGVAARLAKDILGAAVQSEGNLGRVCRAPSGKTNNNEQEDAAFVVLSDAFFILTSPWLRVGRASSASGTTDEDEVADLPSATGKSEQVEAAKGRLLSKISRKHLVEIILPILCNLKSILQASCSPLLKDLMQYLAEMFRAYKVEVKEFLANDPTLLQEVEYDAKKFRKSQLATVAASSGRGVSFVEASRVS